MRKPNYLSPTSLGIFHEDPQEYFLQYLLDDRLPRTPQTQAMSIGSAFDAYVKSHLHKIVVGGNDEKYIFDNIFEAQVEPHNRDWARQHGKYVFEQYKQSKCLDHLIDDLKHSEGSPRFEFEINGVVNGFREGKETEIAGVPLLGKPDCSYINREGAHIILDWKVNGYLSVASPMPGYVSLHKAGGTELKPHKDAMILMHKGVAINYGAFLEDYNDTWATQLTIYAWLLGEPVRSDFIVAIDQIVAKSGSGLPELRFAKHRIRISPIYQQKVFDRACLAWEIINSDHYFRDLSFEDSKAKIELIEAIIRYQPKDEKEAWLFKGCAR